MIMVWMLLVTVQLIAHTVLMKSILPQSLFLLLRSLLDTVRFKSQTVIAVGQQTEDMTFVQVGYFDTKLFANVGMPLQVAFAGSAALFFLALIVAQICSIGDLKYLGCAKQIKRQCYSKLQHLLCLLFAFCFYEVALCCLMSILAYERDRIP